VNQAAVRSLRARVSAQEWALRVDLAACYRLVARYGMTDLIYNHITARVPGAEHHILINAYGMLYEEVTASSLIKVDLAGNIVDKGATDYSVNAAGYIIHSAVHEARADAHCVIHTHTPAGIAVSAMEEGLLPLSQTAMRFHGGVAYHDYEGPAFNLIYWLEQACRIQVQLLSCNRPLHRAAAHVVEETAEALCGVEITLDNEPATNPHLKRDAQRAGSGYGLLEWPALLRALDRQDRSYRD